MKITSGAKIPQLALWGSVAGLALLLALLAASGCRGQAPGPGPGLGGPPPPPRDQAGGYNLDQALSDRAQLTTIAFDGFAFLTGNLGSDSFPPGKVADMWGFQYFRDNDPTQMGHNTDFLTRAAGNMLYTLTADQRAQLVALGEKQAPLIDQYGYERFSLMQAFRRQLTGDLPAGAAGLSREAVQSYSTKLYHLDGEMCLQRAQVMGSLLASLTAPQRAYLDALQGKGMRDWPDVGEVIDKRTMTHDAHVAVMTYAADMASWYLGSVEADVYFCPERQGTYFGGFYLKDAPAMGNPNYSISTRLTGDTGENFVKWLPPAQAQMITGLVANNKPYLQGIVDCRRQIATQLRRCLTGGTPDSAATLAAFDKYGALDGEIIYGCATAFAQVGQALTAPQKAQLAAWRQKLGVGVPQGAFLYSTPIQMPDIPNTDFLFGVK